MRDSETKNEQQIHFELIKFLHRYTHKSSSTTPPPPHPTSAKGEQFQRDLSRMHGFSQARIDSGATMMMILFVEASAGLALGDFVFYCSRGLVQTRARLPAKNEWSVIKFSFIIHVGRARASRCAPMWLTLLGVNKCGDLKWSLWNEKSALNSTREREHQA